MKAVMVEGENASCAILVPLEQKTNNFPVRNVSKCKKRLKMLPRNRSHRLSQPHQKMTRFAQSAKRFAFFEKRIAGTAKLIRYTCESHGSAKPQKRSGRELRPPSERAIAARTPPWKTSPQPLSARRQPRRRQARPLPFRSAEKPPAGRPAGLG